MGRTGMTEGGWSSSFSRTAFIPAKKNREESMLKYLLLSKVVAGEGCESWVLWDIGLSLKSC